MKLVRSLRVALTLAAVFAFGAVAVASASAASFKASEAGTLSGHATTKQEFTFNGGTISCEATASGTITELVATKEKVKIEYEKCTFPTPGVNVTVSPGEFNFYANGEVEFLNAITFNAGICSIKLPPQPGLNDVGFVNNAGRIATNLTVSGIRFTATGFGCGTSGENGTYTGELELELNGGKGSIELAP
jgi:hypothetical protein